MNVLIGENVKHLRTQKGLTQEELADFLGVSFQAVSKWERGLAYPDVEMIPTIANYFDITIDELMGNSRLKAEARICEYLEEYDRLTLLCTQEGNRKKNALAKEAYAEFPYDWRIMDMYRNSLVCGRNAEDFGDTKPTIRSLCEKILAGCTDECFRQSAVSSLLRIAETREEEEHWLALLNDDVCILRGEMREEICFEHSRFDEALRCCQKNLSEYLGWMLAKIDCLISNGWVPEEMQMPYAEKIMVNEKVIGILRLLFENEDFGGWTWNLACKYEENARMYFRLGEIEAGLAAFEQSVEYWVRYDHVPDGTAYTSVLFDRLQFTRNARDTGDMEYKSLGRYLAWIRENPVYDCVREDARFRAAVKRLEDAGE